MQDNDFIKKFANSYEIESNRYSCLMIALGDARKLTGRNTNNGNKELNILQNEKTFLNPYSFIGVINYLLVLDMIGDIFELASFSSKKKNNIFRALKQFGNITNDKDIDTIVALRNSLAHNYGLINIPDSPKEFTTKRHKFILINSDSTVLIQYPTLLWNGDFSDKSDDFSTKIYVDNLIELVESVYLNLNSKIKNNLVSLALSGIDELKARFTIRY